MALQQSTASLSMVEPLDFYMNEEMQSDNKFMTHPGDRSPTFIREAALKEFQAYKDVLTSHGLDITVFQSKPEHETPDAVFPNNWFSTHRDESSNEGFMVTYPMKGLSRRRERRPDIVEFLNSKYPHHIDLSPLEDRAGGDMNGTLGSDDSAAYLEGTGAMVFDRIHRVIYMSLSERADEHAAKRLIRTLALSASHVPHSKGYELITFSSQDRNGHRIYHTNVMMAVGTRVAVVCSEAIVDVVERETVLNRLTESDHVVVEISWSQMENFCGNVLEVKLPDDSLALVMSSRARLSFTQHQIDTLLSHYSELISSDLSTIETYGGGGARCMLAELF
eukprot:GILJ01011685.1.p1 GENE.GILJ01011685.1~~GILJ01011685.1.p1  ORF type:complete len:335 (-),score=41.39 GILJ01011685.1:149-1153(-)